jgi:hypothetical protein
VVVEVVLAQPPSATREAVRRRREDVFTIEPS